ncbi:MAG TPA: electron transport complex subunit E [Bacillota bacterium]|jgi:electron transport complex protein RnfE|nr:electron transport complex subunit E [Bacillota bacterium]HOB86760.1 electron transport complex subunit E [Bacillota bacterium]HOP69654.1 electron transport complex subunit E [Bacillota bacterium]HPT34563.1 electron transport complex subunit E [Bacillota bacterium]HPZ65483.1 electron transport complex subunit E [Bacillota bacterium]
MSSPWKDIWRGILPENPTFRLVLGMCPTLAVTTMVKNGLGMGLSTMAVLICSNVVISALRKLIPEQVRIPVYIVVIATFVTIVEMLLKAFQPDLYRDLGIFIPLIVVNCIILGRAEAFAGKNTIFRSFLDGLGMGLGFTLALLLLSAIREIIGSGTFLAGTGAEVQVFGSGFEPFAVFAAPAGAFVVLGLLIALSNVAFKRFNIG